MVILHEALASKEIGTTAAVNLRRANLIFDKRTLQADGSFRLRSAKITSEF
jgi:hypothetical protein